MEGIKELDRRFNNLLSSKNDLIFIVLFFALFLVCVRIFYLVMANPQNYKVGDLMISLTLYCALNSFGIFMALVLSMAIPKINKKSYGILNVISNLLDITIPVILIALVYYTYKNDEIENVLKYAAYSLGISFTIKAILIAYEADKKTPTS